MSYRATCTYPQVELSTAQVLSRFLIVFFIFYIEIMEDVSWCSCLMQESLCWDIVYLMLFTCWAGGEEGELFPTPLDRRLHQYQLQCHSVDDSLPCTPLVQLTSKSYNNDILFILLHGGMSSSLSTNCIYLKTSTDGDGGSSRLIVTSIVILEIYKATIKGRRKISIT